MNPVEHLTHLRKGKFVDLNEVGEALAQRTELLTHGTSHLANTMAHTAHHYSDAAANAFHHFGHNAHWLGNHSAAAAVVPHVTNFVNVANKVGVPQAIKYALKPI